MMREVAKETGKSVLYGAPPIGVTISNLAGLTLQQWVYVVTIIYTILMILKQFPKMYGCAACFLKHRTCERTCKD